MIEGLPHVPPALLLLLPEIAKCKTPEQTRHRVRGMLRELRDQSEVFEAQAVRVKYEEKTSSQFDIHLDGAMDLLSKRGCLDFHCRTAAAERLAQSVGLIADRVWLTDLLSEKLVEFGRPTDKKLDDVIFDVMALAPLMPLIMAGIVRFRSPWTPVCTACMTIFEERVRLTSEELARTFKNEFSIQKRPGGGFIAKTGKCLEPPLLFSSLRSRLKRLPGRTEFAKYWALQEIRSTIWRAREASLTGGAVFSNSRIGLAALLQTDGRFSDTKTLLLLDRDREFTVPWVSSLDATQIIQLRQEASAALPVFREQMARAMSIRNLETLSSASTSNVIADLRQQAAEVRAELVAKRKYSARYWKTTYGLLGLGLSAYGLATDQIAAGVGGLLPLIHLIINHKTGHEADVEKHTCRPGFVLVKAQDILAHSERNANHV